MAEKEILTKEFYAIINGLDLLSIADDDPRLMMARETAHIEPDTSWYFIPLSQRNLVPFISDYKNGFTDDQLAERYSVTTKTVRRRRQALGLGRPNRRKFWLQLGNTTVVANTWSSAYRMIGYNKEEFAVCNGIKWITMSNSEYQGVVRCYSV